ncbi:MAG: hypothetical protein KDA42_17625 [Planctomycetales bacterium]|nr:hypothetical protein [Planctomycetales bacterium]
MPIKPFEPYTAERLQTVIERLDRLAGRLRAVHDWMEEEGVDSLEITNHKSMIKGLEFAEAFGHASERAVDNYRLSDSLDE